MMMIIIMIINKYALYIYLIHGKYKYTYVYIYIYIYINEENIKHINPKEVNLFLWKVHVKTIQF